MYDCKRRHVIMKARVEKCEISQCAYNSDNQCHAMAITIGGDASHPQCDTFCSATEKGGEKTKIARVGACKVSACTFNKNLECNSPDIMVGYNRGEIDCLTFLPG
jgi:hypothetical protein